MKVELLGSVRLSLDCAPGKHLSRQAATVLSLLALEAGRSVSIGSLIDQLWPDVQLTDARNALQATMTRLRRSMREVGGADEVAGKRVRSVHSGYVLDVPRSDIDAFVFTTSVRRARTELTVAPGKAVETIEAALALWQGDALDGVADTPVLDAERVRLDEQRLVAQELLAEARIADGDVRAAVGDLIHLVHRHGERERLNELLMLALHLDGRQTEALDHFSRLRVRLRDELGIDPSKRLFQMQHAILSRDEGLDPRRGTLAGV